MANQKLISGLQDLALAVLVGTAAGAVGAATGTLGWILIVLPCAVFPFWRIRSVSPLVRVWVRNAAWCLMAIGAALAKLLDTYPILSTPAKIRWILLDGYGLAAFATVFFLGSAVWEPAWTLIPVSLLVLAVACCNPAAGLTYQISAAGLAVFAYLALGSAVRPAATLSAAAAAPAGPRFRRALGRGMRLAATGIAVLGLAMAINQVVPWTQVRVEQVTASFLSSQTTEYSSFSLESRLGDLEELHLSDKVVLRAWTSRPQMLRGRVFAQFDGAAWHARTFPGVSLTAAPSNISLDPETEEWIRPIPGGTFLFPGRAANSKLVLTKIVQAWFNPGLMVSPGRKVLVRAPLESLRLDPYEGLAPPISAKVQIYGIVNRWDSEVAQTAAPAREALAEYLALPPDTDPRWKVLAARLAAESTYEQDRVDRVVRTVRDGAGYSLKVGKFHSRQPVAEFFFEKKQGYCQYFASAAAILLRLEGIPTRYVTGFMVKEWNHVGGYYVVREADAHAWIEAYVPGKGWVTADPTPQAEFDARQEVGGGGWLSQVAEWLQARVYEAAIRFQAGDWRAEAAWLWGALWHAVRIVFVDSAGYTALFILLLALVVFLIRRRRPERSATGPAAHGTGYDSPPIPAELASLLVQLDGMWAREGFARPAWRAPLEHLDNIPPQKLAASRRESCRRVVECFYRASFGGAHVNLQEVRELQQAMARSGGD